MEDRTVRAMKPIGINIRMYDVGHGDCFLLSFHYGRQSRHLLIDFGTRQPSHAAERDRLVPIAKNIAEHCGPQLHAIVATHAHRDHIGGFECLSRISAPGNIISRLKPQLVIQPKTNSAVLAMEKFYAAYSGAEESNRRSMERLTQLGTSAFVYAGKNSGLEKLFPGISFRVLGPPLNHSPAKLLEFWKSETRILSQDRHTPLFPAAPQFHPCLAPPQTRWFIDKISHLHDEQLLRLAQAINTEINNTSVILLIEGCGHKLLFPGDAEIDAWTPLLANPRIRNLLSGVTVYKASHHGSPNGTPRKLTSLFGDNIITLLSTSNSGIENPLGPESPVIDTRSLRAQGKLFHDLHLDAANANSTLEVA